MADRGEGFPASWTWNSLANDEFEKSSLQTGLHLSFRDLPVAEEAEILIDAKEGKLTDLKFGIRFYLELSTEGGRMVVRGIRAED